MGDPGLLQKIPDIPALLPQGSGDREQAAAADRTLAGLDAMADLALNHRLAQGALGGIVRVGLELVERCPDVGLVIGGVLEFDHRQGQTIDVDHQIRAEVVPGALDRELVHHQPIIGGRVAESDHLEANADLLAPIHLGDR